MLAELTKDWPASLQTIVSGYVSGNGLQEEKLLRVDLVLILLRLADGAADDFVRRECLERVAELTGKAITKCPSAVPPWPPKPVQPSLRASCQEPTLIQVKPNPCVGEMRHRYEVLKVGMTLAQARSHGVTSRDIRYWEGLGHITVKYPKKVYHAEEKTQG